MPKEIRHINDTWLPLQTEVSSRWGRGKEISIDFLPTLNDDIWGLRKKKLVVIAGRVSMGKSALMMNMAWSFANHGKRVLFCNLETTNQEFSERLFCYLTKTENKDIHTGRVALTDEYAKKFTAVHEQSSKTNLILAESYGYTFDELLNVVEKTGDKYDVVLIDYLQKIKINHRSEREALDVYLNALCDLAITKNLCIVLGSQIHRATFDGKKVEPPMLHELKGSGGIEEKAHMVWLLHWHWKYNKEADKHHYRIDIAKNKDGRSEVYEATFYPETYRICEDIIWETQGDKNGRSKKSYPKDESRADWNDK